MRSPFSPFYLLLFSFVLGVLFFYLQLIVVNEVAEKLGLTANSALLLFASSLFGSAINLPLFTLHTQPPIRRPPQLFAGLLRLPTKPFAGKTVIAVNVGGCLIPIGFSLFLLDHNPIPLPALLIALSTVTAVSYGLSRPIPGIGIGIPVLVPPLTAALIAFLLGGEMAAPLAYIAGTLGVLLGADVFRLRDIRDLGAPFASIGGAGTFDGIFMTGIVAVFIA